jgi:hypothetical protein
MSEADSARVRWRAIVIVVIGAAVGAALIASGHRFAPALAGAPVALVLAVLGVLCVVPLLGFATYLWRLGARALDAGQFPPPGTEMVHRGPALVGAPARRRARLAQAFAAFLGGAAVVLAALLWRLSALLPAR